MRITILTVPECPNVAVVRERITAALGGRSTEVEVVEVRAQGEAARWGMTGSPTVLVDGADPFAVAGAPPSVSCRLYRDADGRVDGAPSVEDLRQVLSGAVLARETAGDQECCETDLLDPIGHAGRGRRAPAERGLRTVHQAVLRHFAAEGAAPEASVLEAVAALAGRTAADVLAELDREDFLTLDGTGRIRAAYPFSTVQTRHRVRLLGGVEVWSMCAVDALGISAMLGGQDVRISSSDPVNSEPVKVTFTGGTARWEAGGLHCVHRPPRWRGPCRHGVLRHAELLHRTRLGRAVAARAPRGTRPGRRPRPGRPDRRADLRPTPP